VEMEHSFLFVTAAGEGSCLAVLSPASADAGLIAYEMALLVKRVGQHLSVTRRPVAAGGTAEGGRGCIRPRTGGPTGERGPWSVRTRSPAAGRAPPEEGSTSSP